MNKRTAKAKRWIKNHHEQIVLCSGITVLVGAYAAICVLAVKQEQAQAEHDKKVRDWTISENSKGRSVFQLADGNLISVSSSDLLN